MNIKFISYDGEYPNLCSGTLTLEIDGEIYYFNGYGKKGENHFGKFWTSGGSVWFDDSWNDYVSSGPWQLYDENELPDFLKPHAEELIDIFNANVPYGCCGGCV